MKNVQSNNRGQQGQGQQGQQSKNDQETGKTNRGNRNDEVNPGRTGSDTGTESEEAGQDRVGFAEKR
ncbi:MAG: hypothetical protein AAB544_06050 [Patescibacteria group bacterium]